MTLPVRRVARAGVAVCAALALGGCGLGRGLYNVPLPGGADLGSHPYSVTAHFRDALDLVPQSAVKVNDVAVGRVTSITIERNGRIADVHVTLNGSVRLPANAVAAIRQTSLLGEKYVELATPLGVPATGRLTGGAVIGVSRTTDGVQVEQVFGALSLLLNGGGIGQLHDILVAFNRFAGGGHESDIRALLAGVNTGVAALDKQRSSITQALGALSTLSATLRSNNAQIDRVLTSLSPGIAVLADQQRQVNSLVAAFGRLSTVTVATLQASKDDIVADLRSLAPTLSQLAQAGQALPESLQVLLTYPFPDAALQGLKGDYLNAFARTALNTPGGSVVKTDNWPGVTDATTSLRPASRSASSPSATPVISPPPALLPPTTSAAPGLSSTVTLPAPSTSTSASASASASGSSSSSPAASSSAAGSPSASSPTARGSGAGSSSATGSRSARPTGTTASTATSSPRSVTTAPGGH